MNYDLTPERRDYINARGYTLLTACPGSGKTTSIAYKLGELAVHSNDNVLCLSFTNNAVNELDKAYNLLYGIKLSYPHKILTIDSFLSQYIVLPFWYLIKGLTKRPSIMDDTHNSPLYECSYIDKGERKSRFYTKLSNNGYKYYVSHKDSDFSRDVKGDLLCDNRIITSMEGLEVARHILQRRLNLGILTSGDIEYYAYNIINNYPQITQALAHRFSYIIMDEAQDMSSIQYEIIKLLIAGGLRNVEFVGDLRQSIYSWRNANPDIFKSLLKDEKWTKLNFVHNRRSVQQIIDQYNLIKSATDANTISHKVSSMNIPIHVYHFEENQNDIVIDLFFQKCKDHSLSKRQVICRGKTQLKELLGLQDTDDCWKSKIPHLLITAVNHFNLGQVNESVKLMKKVWSLVKDEQNGEDFANRALLIDSSFADVSKLIALLRDIPSLELSISEWQAQTERLLERFCNLQDGLVNFKFKRRMNGYKMSDISKMRVIDYFHNTIRRNPSEFSTVHGIKGLTFDACLVFLNKNHSETLSLELFAQCAELKERHRLLYVACSRPRQFLAFAIPKSVRKELICKYILPNFTYIDITNGEKI